MVRIRRRQRFDVQFFSEKIIRLFTRIGKAHPHYYRAVVAHRHIRRTETGAFNPFAVKYIVYPQHIAEPTIGSAVTAARTFKTVRKAAVHYTVCVGSRRVVEISANDYRDIFLYGGIAYPSYLASPYRGIDLQRIPHPYGGIHSRRRIAGFQFPFHTSFSGLVPVVCRCTANTAIRFPFTSITALMALLSVSRNFI